MSEIDVKYSMAIRHAAGVVTVLHHDPFRFKRQADAEMQLSQRGNYTPGGRPPRFDPREKYVFFGAVIGIIVGCTVGVIIGSNTIGFGGIFLGLIGGLFVGSFLGVTIGSYIKKWVHRPPRETKKTEEEGPFVQ